MRTLTSDELKHISAAKGDPIAAGGFVIGAGIGAVSAAVLYPTEQEGSIHLQMGALTGVFIVGSVYEFFVKPYLFV